MSYPHYSDIGTEITLDFDEDVSSLTVAKIIAKKPDRITTVLWTASLASGNEGITYTIKDGDLDQAGVWVLQGYVELSGGWSGYSTTTEMTVKARLADAS